MELIPIDQVRQMSKTVTMSGLMGFKNENQAMTLMLLAQAENKHPMTAMQQYHIINGKPALKSTEVLSRFQQSGGKIKYLKSDDDICEAEFSHPQGGELTISWDIAKAKRAGVYDTNPVWKKYPSNMLRSRVITDGVKALYPVCLNGFMSETEAQDIPTEDETETVEIIETKNIDTLKTELATKLRKRGLTNGMMKEFYEKYVNDENIEDVINNKLDELLLEFENGNE